MESKDNLSIQDKFWSDYIQADELERLDLVGKLTGIKEYPELRTLLNSYFEDLVEYLTEKNLWQHDVEAFHQKFGLTVKNKPTTEIKYSDIKLRHAICQEECNELVGHLEAMCMLFPILSTSKRIKIMADITDGIADVIYVALGTASTLGINMQPIWNAIHQANMTKEGGAIRDDGKILKPEGWKHPDIKKLIGEQT